MILVVVAIELEGLFKASAIYLRNFVRIVFLFEFVFKFGACVL